MSYWLNNFKINDTLMVLDSSSLIRNPYEVLCRVEDFLELSHKIDPAHIVFNEHKGYFCKFLQ